MLKDVGMACQIAFKVGMIYIYKEPSIPASTPLGL